MKHLYFIVQKQQTNAFVTFLIIQTELTFGVNYYIPCRNVSSKHQHPTLVLFNSANFQAILLHQLNRI